MNARGVLDGEFVVVENVAEANRLHSKGHYGTPQSGNSLQLSRIEAAHLVHMGRLDVDVPFADLLKDEVAYLAYADLRERGLVVRHDGDGFVAWQRGEGPKQAPWFRFLATSEREPIRAQRLLDFAGIVGVVDEDGAVTHYQIEAIEPEGTVMAVDHPSIKAELLRDRVLVADGASLAAEAIGTVHGDVRVLSFTEAAALYARGLTQLDVAEHAAARQQHFARTLPVYQDLRRRGVVARSGFRFGTHLRGYRTLPDDSHADWLIQCPGDAPMHWSELSRGVRLAHGVRKQFVLAAGNPVRYSTLAWFRP